MHDAALRITYWRLAGETVGLVRRGWWPVLWAQLFCKAAALLIMGPLAVCLLGALLGDSGAVANAAVARFALSPAGVAGLLFLATLVLTGMLVELAFMVVLMHQAAHGQTGRHCLADALASALGRLPQLSGLAGALVLRAGALLAVLLVGLWITYSLLLSGADINFYLSTRPPAFIAAVGIGLLLAALCAVPALVLYARAFIALPICLFEGRRGRDALAAAATMPRSHSWMVLVASVAWLVVRVAGLAVLAVVLGTLSRLAAGQLMGKAEVDLWWVVGLIIINGALLALAAALDQAGFSALIELVHRHFRGGGHAAMPAVPARARRAASWILAAGLAASACVAAVNVVFVVQRLVHRRAIAITAHRAGAGRAPENSISALQMAIADGAGSAEIDVQRSADGQIVVVHDRDLLRMAGEPLVISQSTFEQLRQADIGRLVGPGFAGERVATLGDFVAAGGNRIGLCVELKYYEPRDESLAPQVLAALRQAGAAAGTRIISLDVAGLEQVRALDPSMPVGCLVSASVGDVTALDIDFLSVSRSNLTPALRRKADARGLKVAVWTVNTREEAIRMIARGADEIVTDEPAIIAEAVRWYGDLSDIELMLLRLREWLRG